MMQLRSGILGLALTSALALSASAADIYSGPVGPGGYKDGPYVPVATWTGFYIGVNGGYAWSDSDEQFADVYFEGLSPQGGFGGGQIGYNWQGFGYSPLVIGIEADIQGSGIEDSATDVAGVKFKSQVDWFGTVRGRLGYAFDRALIYGTGGFAFGSVNNRVNDDGVLYKKDDTATGWVAGGGVEYKINPAWSLKVEYQYINLGDNEPTLAGVGVGEEYGFKVEDDAFHTVRVGLNYKIGGTSYEPLK